MSERRDKIKLQDGFTLVELLVAITIISIVAAVAIPQFTAYKTRAYDTHTQSNLRSFFMSCKDYWTYNSSTSPCVLTAVSNNEYGFIPSADVEVTIDSDADNTEYDFYATARHTSSSTIFVIDYRGVISKATIEYGCSEGTQEPPIKHAKEAAGSCGTAPSKPKKPRKT